VEKNAISAIFILHYKLFETYL